jgi:hypothetical protein
MRKSIHHQLRPEKNASSRSGYYLAEAIRTDVLNAAAGQLSREQSVFLVAPGDRAVERCLFLERSRSSSFTMYSASCLDRLATGHGIRGASGRWCEYYDAENADGQHSNQAPYTSTLEINAL